MTPDKKSPDNTKVTETNDGPQQKSKTDPQLTELDGLKKGGVEPTVNPEDRAKDEDGKTD